MNHPAESRQSIPRPHGNKLALNKYANDTDYYLDGNDGGVYESFDRGRTWKFMPNLPLTQFYKVAVDYDLPFYNIYGGTQDNGSFGGPSRTTSAGGIVNADWYSTQGSDGFESAADPEDPNIVYAQSQYGDLGRYDRKSGESTGIQPKPHRGEAEYRWNWDSPLFVSPHSHTRLYLAANKVFRSDDRGDSWTVISDDLTRRIDRNTLEIMGRVWPLGAVAKSLNTSPYGNIVALDESPVAEGLLYAGTVPFKVQALTSVSLPAADRAELASFQKKVRKLGNSVNGASNAVADLLALAGNCRTALKSVTLPH